MLLVRIALLPGIWMLLSGASTPEAEASFVMEKLYMAGLMLLCAAFFGGGGDDGDWGDGDGGD